MKKRSWTSKLINTSLCVGLALLTTITTAGERDEKEERHGKKKGHAKEMTAWARIKGCTDKYGVSGKAQLRERYSEEGIKLVDIVINVKGLERGKHAVHIHETANCTPCGAANGHFDPGPFGFSSPDGNHPYHAGDLINIKVDRHGRGTLWTTTSRVTLSPGPLTLFDHDGSAVIIHVDPDTDCPKGEKAGCAGGARAACGIIVAR